MKKTLLTLASFFLISLFILSGCQSQPASSSDPAQTRTITDMTGAQVEIPVEVKSVANLWPSNNQIMILLGATEKQTAYHDVLKGQNYTWMQTINPLILERPSFGASGTITVEELIALDPDLILASNANDAAAYREAGLPALCIMFSNYEGLRKSIAITAEALGGDAPARAQAYVDYLDSKIALAEQRLADLKDEDKPTVYYMDGQNGKTPYITSGNGTVQEEWITMAGGKLATDGLLSGLTQEITAEQLLALDPDYVLIGGTRQADSYDMLMADQALLGLTAVKEGRVFRIPQGTFPWCRFSSESALQVLWTAKTIHPDRFQDIDIKAETIDFYKNFLGYDLSSEYADAILAGKNAPTGK